MERRIMVEGNHCKSNVNIVSKSDGPFIQIDSISIDLVSAKDKSDAGKYAALVLLGNIISYGFDRLIKIRSRSNKLGIFWSSMVKTGEKKEEKQIWLAVRNNSAMQILLEDFEHDSLHEVFEFSIEVLARIDHDCGIEVSLLQSHQGVHLPRQLRDQLLQELEAYILGSLVDNEIEKNPFSDIFFRFLLFSNFIDGSCFMRIFKAFSSVNILVLYFDILHPLASDVGPLYFFTFICLGSDSIFGGKNSLLSSLQSFICCPIFMKWRDQNHMDVFLYGSVMQSMERLLHALMKLYEEDSEWRLTHLGDLVNEVADLDLLDWFGCVRLIDCTCGFVLLCLQIGQLNQPPLSSMVEFGKDLTKSNEIWQISNSEEWQRAMNGGTAMDDKESDSSNFGVTLVVSSKEKLGTAREVLGAGPQPQPTLVTVFITLMHIAIYSEEVELEVACQLLAVLVKNHFVPIFAICMALHCIKESGWEKAAIVPQSSILPLAEVSGSERDKLIKEHMVCICFSSLSLSKRFSVMLIEARQQPNPAPSNSILGNWD
uniref:Uncharacterized protein n=1 Tax=Quercus lobata TaxID=97700 RepID=A0A7N2KNE5_QUELO